MGRDTPRNLPVCTDPKESIRRGNPDRIEESDHRVRRSNGRWIAEWNWKSTEPPLWKPEGFQEWYKKRGVSEDQMDAGVKEWLETGVIEPIARSEVRFAMTLNPVVSEAAHKTTKLRLAIDFKPLNRFVSCLSTTSSNEDSLRSVREWRKYKEGTLVDLTKAYLSIVIDKSLQQYQCIRWRGRYYRCCRLMFGLSVAPRILYSVMCRTLQSVMSSVKFFRDDLLVLNHLDRVLRCLKQNGFKTKPGQRLGHGSVVRILGLVVQNNEWRREELFPGYWNLTIPCSIRDALGYVARVANIAPVQGTVRVIATMLRSSIGKCVIDEDWDRMISDETIYDLMRQLDHVIKTNNPMKGIWHVDCNNWVLYTDASKDLLGAVLLDSNGAIIADWCQTIRNARHINLNELDALVKGFSQLLLMYAKPGAVIRVCCDNKTVVNWVQNWMNELPMKSSSDSWHLVERRLQLIGETISAFDFKFTIEFVTSEKNLADHLTRLPSAKSEGTVAVVVSDLYCPVPITLAWWRKLRFRNSVVKEQLLRRAHEELGHSSINQLVAVATRFFELNNSKELRRECEVVTSHCAICQQKRLKLSSDVSEYALSKSTEVGQAIQIDTVKIDEVYFYSVIDMCSRYAQLYPVEERPSGKDTRQVLSQWVANIGVIPKIIRVDNGSEFAVHLDEWARERGAAVRHGAVSNPQSQAMVERLHRSLLTIIRCLEASSLKERVFRALQIYNLRPHAAFNFRMSPLEAKEKVRLRGWETMDGMDGDSTTSDDELFIEDSVDNNVKIEETKFAEGERIWWRNPSAKKSEIGWKSGVVLKVYGRGGYLVRFDSGAKPERVVNEKRMVKLQTNVNEPLPTDDDQAISDIENDDDDNPDIQNDHNDIPETDEQPTLRRSIRTHKAPKRYGFD
jgi:hypothetical protein